MFSRRHSSSCLGSRWSLEPVLVGAAGFEMHHDRHRHPLRWRLLKAYVGENLVFDGAVQRRITGRLPQGYLADFSRGVSPDPHLDIHDGGTGLFVGTQHFDYATLHLPGVIPVLTAATSASATKAGAPSSTISHGKTRAIFTLDACG